MKVFIKKDFEHLDDLDWRDCIDVEKKKFIFRISSLEERQHISSCIEKFILEHYNHIPTSYELVNDIPLEYLKICLSTYRLPN